MNIRRLLDIENFELESHCVEPNAPAMEVLEKLGKRGENAILVVKDRKLYASLPNTILSNGSY